MKKAVAVVAALIGSLVVALGFDSGTVSAHKVIVSGVADCVENGEWTITWTLTPDRTDGTDSWAVLTPRGYTPDGPQATGLPFTRVETVPATVDRVTEGVEVEWTLNGRRVFYAKGWDTVRRPTDPCTAPPATTVPPTTAPPTTVPPTTVPPTTVPPTTAPPTTVPPTTVPPTTAPPTTTPSQPVVLTPSLSGAPTCLDNGTWQVTWTLTSDGTAADSWVVDTPSEYTPGGSQAADQPFNRIGSYTLADTTVTETVDVTFTLASGGTQNGTASATVEQPDECEEPPDPAPPTEVSPSLVGTTACLDNGTWQVTWTATSDGDATVSWTLDSPAGYAPAGSQAADQPFNRIGSYTLADATVTETVAVTFTTSGGETLTGSATASADLPESCEDGDNSPPVTTPPGGGDNSPPGQSDDPDTPDDTSTGGSLPETGSDGTRQALTVALLLLVLGGAAFVIAHPARRDEATD